MTTHKQDLQIAPSILSADFAKLGQEVDAVITAGANMIHFDVMDNHYVENLTIGPLVCDSLRNYGVKVPIDVHLMVKPVDRLIPDFAKAGASIITFHPEASLHVDRTIQLIKSVNCKAGLVLNPASPLELLDPVLDQLDMVLLMSVNPGFPGQSFIEHVYRRIRAVREKIDRLGLPIRLEVDGGIGLHNIAKVAESGADTFVMGSAIFNSPDYEKTFRDIRNALKTSL